MSAYHFYGSLSTAFFTLSLVGLIIQIRLILRRRADPEVEHHAAVLSINQFGVSFLGYYSFFIYGFCLERFNHYLVWPRLIALSFVAAIFYLIYEDRRNRSSYAALVTVLLLLLLGVLALLADPGVTLKGKGPSQVLIVATAILLIQGYVHQIYVMWKKQAVGAVSWKMHFLVMVKDLSLLGFGLSMGMQDGWPVFLLGAISALTKVALLYVYARISAKSKD